MPRVVFFLVAAVLPLTGLVGIRSSVSDLNGADTLGKMVHTGFLGAGGCLGITAGGAVLARSIWAKVLILGCAATLFTCLIQTPFVWPWPGIVPLPGASIDVPPLTAPTTVSHFPILGPGGEVPGA